jgi:FAD/FMN-containing dehydrogenase
LTGPNVTVSQLKEILTPLMDKLDELDIKYTSFFGQFDSYLAFFNAMFAPIQVGIAQYGGRLIPRSVVENNGTALTDAYRFINEQGAQFIGVAANTSLARAGYPDNAVNPAWRDNLIDTVITTPWNFTGPWEDMLANQDLMTDVLMPKLAELTPNGGAYLNEADFKDPDWKQTYYGVNYPRLLEIKDKYDPDHLFYAVTAVGSDYWEPQEDGRLCKA